MEDNRSCVRNFSRCENHENLRKKIQACSGFEPMPCAKPVQCSYHFSLTSQLGVVIVWIFNTVEPRYFELG